MVNYTVLQILALSYTYGLNPKAISNVEESSGQMLLEITHCVCWRPSNIMHVDHFLDEKAISNVEESSGQMLLEITHYVYWRPSNIMHVDHFLDKKAISNVRESSR